MKIEYGKPWYITSNLSEPINNVLSEGPYTISITFRVDKNYKKDNKIGFFGIPGKNFGISYDYEVNYFVFEFWTKELDSDGVEKDKFNYFLYDTITEEDYQNFINVTIQYDGNTYHLYKNYNLLGTIQNPNPLVSDYINESIYLGCHNIDSVSEKHKCSTEIDINHFSIFKDVIDIKNIESYVDGKTELTSSKDLENVYVFFDLEHKHENIDIVDKFNKNIILKRKNKITYAFENIKEKLDSVGCGFCLAKWTQVTMHLHNGTTHSCHHPVPHKVTLEEIERNPTALHNSTKKKQARKEMLEGKRPYECNYCWNVEDNSQSFSDRVFKSSEPWSEPYFDEIKNMSWRDNFNPKYVEVSFSNTCNFKCAYCGPEYSSKWMEEINQYGGYNLSIDYNGIERLEQNKTKPYKHSEHNPYVDAFWNWWPELYGTLDTFRITGGEPLLSKDTWGVLDYIIKTETPNKNLKLSINSNLGVTDDLIDRFIEKVSKILNEGRVKELILFTSCDAFGKQAEYVRYGLDFDKLFFNIDKILTELPKVTVVIMSTFNIFSIFSYEKLIRKVHSFKLKHHNNERFWNSALILDTSYLRYPDFLGFRLLKGYLNVEYYNRCEKFMKFNSTYRSLNSFEPQSVLDVGFSMKEIEKLTRIKDIFISDANSKDRVFHREQQDFLKFIREYEKRRHVKCEDFFPELTDFIKNIENEN